MRSLIPIKLVCRLLLVVMITTVMSGVCHSAHALQRSADAPDGQVLISHVDTGSQCPCCPSEEPAGHEECNLCCDCACHTSLSYQPFTYSYTPVVSDLQTSDPFSFLPEVFLSKFVPPQLQA